MLHEKKLRETKPIVDNNPPREHITAKEWYNLLNASFSNGYNTPKSINHSRHVSMFIPGERYLNPTEKNRLRNIDLGNQMLLQKLFDVFSVRFILWMIW